jgi:multiple sugar transport system substrate-binding protein
VKTNAVNMGATAPEVVAPTPTSQGVASLQVAQTTEKKKIPLPVIIVAAVVLVLGVGGFFLWNWLSVDDAPVAVTAPEAIVLDYWGLWESSASLNEVFRLFTAENPGISVNYIKQSEVGYLAALQGAMAAGGGPDIFRFHATWVPQLVHNLDVMPHWVMTPEYFEQNHYPVMFEQLSRNYGTQIVGMPLMYEGLALLYNVEEFNRAGVAVPTTWGEFRNVANILTETNEYGQIMFAGAAIGLADNVDHFSDLLALLIVQNGGDLRNLNSQEVQDALSFYSSFYNPVDHNVRVWDSSFERSKFAFARGEVAMIFAPSWAMYDIWIVNPGMSVGVAQVPQLDDRQPVGWATYWVEGVNNNSPAPRREAAWRLLNFMNRPDILEIVYGRQTDVREFGTMFPRPEMAGLQANDRFLQPYLAQAPYAVSYFFAGATFDDGLNQRMIDALGNAVNAVNQGRITVDRVARDLHDNVSRILRDFPIE